MKDGDARPNLTMMLATLKEAQDTVRMYDTKAQIVGVGYIFATGIIFELGDMIGRTSTMNLITVILAWVIIVIPIALFGTVLYPTRKVAPKILGDAGGAERIVYAETDRFHSVPEYLAAVEASEPRIEIAYEILKTSGLRELKRRRFLRALWAAAASFVVVFAGQVLRVEGIEIF